MEVSEFSSLCQFTFGFGHSYEVVIVGDAFAFDLGMDVVKRFSDERADSVCSFIIGEKGDDSVADVCGHLTDLASEVRVREIVVDVEDLAN